MIYELSGPEARIFIRCLVCRELQLDPVEISCQVATKIGYPPDDFARITNQLQLRRLVHVSFTSILFSSATSEASGCWE